MLNKQIIIAGLCVWFLSAMVIAEDAKTTDFTGTVVNTAGEPIEGASLDLYLLTIDHASFSYSIQSMAKTTSNAEGAFSFVVGTEAVSGYAVFFCLAQKKGLACDWAAATRTTQATWQFTLGDPHKIIGFVQNPDGTAVVDAEVRLLMLSQPGGEEHVMMGIEPVEAFVTKTCSDGRFEFGNLPADATVEFLVKKDGKGAFHTMNFNVSPEDGLTYKPGQSDIMLTMSDACAISGTVFEKGSQNPVPNVKVMVRDESSPVNMIHKPVTTDADGTFAFAQLAAGNYTVSVLDDNWIAKGNTLNVTTDAVAETALEVTKGGLLEIKVIDGETKEPVSNVSINARNQDTQEYQQFVTDQDGLGSKQVLSGTYEVSVYRQGYRSTNSDATVTVEDNKTATLTVELGGQPKIKGFVTDANGNPVEGAVIRLIPNWGGEKISPMSDEKGQFTLSWDPERIGWSEGEYYLTAMHEDKKLVAVLAITEDTSEATIKLEEGSSCSGRVTDTDGQPIVGARTSLHFCGSRFSTSFGIETKTDDTGSYTFSPLATEQRYSVRVSNVTGYGTGQKEVELEFGSKEGTLEDVILPLADQKVTGQVVDIDGKGLEGVQLHCYGSGQPNLNVKTDAEGKFVLENVCAGEISISANRRIDGKYLNGHLRTEGGATDVKLILSDQSSSSQGFVPKQAASMMGKPLGDLTDCGIEIPADAKEILVFVWDMNQRPSRHFIKEFNTQSAMLKEKGVTVLLVNAGLVQRPKLDAWLAENAITYPCGSIAENAEDVLFKMGVRSMPWLILTDAEHNVVAEGFSVSELDEKLDQ